MKNTSQASNVIQNALNDHRFGMNNRQFMPPQANFDSPDNFDSLSKDLRERLMCSDRDSGRSTATASPNLSGFSNSPSCASPAPSDLGSETSKTSTSDYDFSRRHSPFQKPNTVYENGQQPYSPTPNTQNSMSKMMQPSRPLRATGSGGTATISVKEEDGKKTLTSEKSSLVQERDGYLESNELAAEVTEKDSQAARREATTRMMKHDEDPEGKFKQSEAADASDVSETMVKHMPDGSVMTIKSSSTSTSNFKESFSSGGQMPSLFNQNFPSGMGDIGFMGRSQPLMSQNSSDSVASNMSNFSDMSNFSRMSDMSHFSNMSNRSFPRMPDFPNFPEMPNRLGFSNFPTMNTFNQGNPNPSGNTFSTSSQSSYSTSSYETSKKH